MDKNGINYERKDIPGFPGYQVDTEGNVFSCLNNWGKITPNWRMRKTFKGKDGYIIIRLYRNKKAHAFYLHRLVLEVFVGIRPEGYITRHFPDKNKENNRLINIQWGTPLENSQDAKIQRTERRAFGNSSGVSKMTEEMALKIKLLLKDGEKCTIIAKKLGVSKHQVYHIKSGVCWKHIKVEETY